MVIAIASGKGGTGKTTVATNLAIVLARSGRQVQLLDCDVEEPNCHLFVHPEIRQEIPVSVGQPAVADNLCRGCGKCSELCQFGAIICLGDRVAVFPELCHSCGGCMLVCPEGAITEQMRQVGMVELGAFDGVAFGHGRLNVGEARAIPVIAELKRQKHEDAVVIIDGPPGTSCPVIEAVKGSDFVCLVTEPTPFGLHDLIMAADVVRQLQLPMGVVINRSGIGDDRVQQYCRQQGIAVLAEIRDDRRIAEAYSRGELAVEACPELGQVFHALAEEISRQVRP